MSLVNEKKKININEKAFLKKMLISSRSTTFLLNSCAHHIKCRFCDTNTLFDSKCYSRENYEEIEDPYKKVVIDEVGYKIIYFKSDDKLLSATG